MSASDWPMGAILASHWSIVNPLLKDMRTHRRKNEQTGGDRDTMTIKASECQNFLSV